MIGAGLGFFEKKNHSVVLTSRLDFALTDSNLHFHKFPNLLNIYSKNKIILPRFYITLYQCPKDKCLVSRLILNYIITS